MFTLLYVKNAKGRMVELTLKREDGTKCEKLYIHAGEFGLDLKGN